MKRRLVWGDIARIIAALFVIIIHVTSDAFYYYAVSHNYDRNFLVVSTIQSITRAAVPIFFLLTGAFALKNVTNYSDHLKKVFTRLVLPLLIFSVIIYIQNSLMSHQPISVGGFLLLFLDYYGVRYHMWFMYVIILFYLFIPFLYKLVSNLSQKQLLLMIALIFITGPLIKSLSFILGQFGFYYLRNIGVPDQICYLNYLFIGYYIMKYPLGDKLRNVIYTLGVASLILLPIVEFFIIPRVNSDSFATANHVLPFLMGLALFVLFKEKFSKPFKSSHLNSTITWCAGLTFYLFMIHTAFIDIFRPYFLGLYNVSLPKVLLGHVVVTTLVFICSLLFAVIFDKVYSILLQATSRVLHRLKNSYN